MEGEKIALEIIEEAKKMKGQMNENATLEARQPQSVSNDSIDIK